MLSFLNDCPILQYLSCYTSQLYGEKKSSSIEMQYVTESHAKYTYIKVSTQSWRQIAQPLCTFKHRPEKYIKCTIDL